jgi:hypothetical protein
LRRNCSAATMDRPCLRRRSGFKTQWPVEKYREGRRTLAPDSTSSVVLSSSTTTSRAARVELAPAFVGLRFCRRVCRRPRSFAAERKTVCE